MLPVLQVIGNWLIAASVTAAPAATDAQAKWETVFNRPAELAKLDRPVVCILDIQHPDIIKKQFEEKPLDQYSGRRFQKRVAEISGLPCLLVHFTELKGADLERPQVKAILITGRSKSLRSADKPFYELIRTTRIPMLGFCGGMQLIGQAHEAKVGPLRKLRPDETDPNPKYHAGLFKEWGFLPVAIVRDDPLFAGLPREMTLREMHAYQILEPPADFDLLASSPECRVQAIKHRGRILYGAQFHAEAYDDDHPQGKTILENFFRIAGVTGAKRK